MALQNEILRILSDTDSALTTTSLQQRCAAAVSKFSVNEVLYSLREQGLVQFTPGSPPLWRIPCPLLQVPVFSPPDSSVLIILDLGNVHCCLAKLLPYAAKGALEVKAYADFTFSGYGVNPPLCESNVSVFRADTPTKNSADVQIIWELSRYVLEKTTKEPHRRIQVFVCTRDLGFLRLKALVEENPQHSLDFVVNWEALKMHIE
jgi:hypothetical protein